MHTVNVMIRKTPDTICIRLTNPLDLKKDASYLALSSKAMAAK